MLVYAYVGDGSYNPHSNTLQAFGSWEELYDAHPAATEDDIIPIDVVDADSPAPAGSLLLADDDYIPVCEHVWQDQAWIGEDPSGNFTYSCNKCGESA